MERLFAAVLFHARESRGLTQKKMGELMGVPPTSITAFESARRPVGEDAIERFAGALGLSVIDLFAEYIDAKRAGKALVRGAPPPVPEEPFAPPGPARDEQLSRLMAAHRDDMTAVAKAVGVSRQAVAKALQRKGVDAR